MSDSEMKTGHIYIIKCRDPSITDCYIGATENYKRRMSVHESVCNSKTNKTRNLKVYKFIRKNGGWDNWKTRKIKRIRYKTGEEKHALEAKYYKKYGATLNTNIPNRSIRQYIKDNREKINKRKREWYHNNKDKARSSMKKYMDGCRNYWRQYYNKKSISKVQCECGATVCYSYLHRHKQTKKHLNLLKCLNKD